MFEVRVHTLIHSILMERGSDKLTRTNSPTGKILTLHFDVNNADLAKKRAAKRGRVISCQKVSVDEYTNNIEHLELNQQPLGLRLGVGVYERDIDLDSILGIKKKPFRDASGKEINPQRHDFNRQVRRFKKEYDMGGMKSP